MNCEDVFRYTVGRGENCILGRNISLNLWGIATWFFDKYPLMAWKWSTISTFTPGPSWCSCGLVNLSESSPAPILAPAWKQKSLPFWTGWFLEGQLFSRVKFTAHGQQKDDTKFSTLEFAEENYFHMPLPLCWVTVALKNAGFVSSSIN